MLMSVGNTDRGLVKVSSDRISSDNMKEHSGADRRSGAWDSCPSCPHNLIAGEFVNRCGLPGITCRYLVGIAFRPKH